jgi:integrase
MIADPTSVALVAFVAGRGDFARRPSTLWSVDARSTSITKRWQQAVADGRRFVTQFGEQAEALGWASADLFGLHTPPEKPTANYRRLSRYDQTGLIWLLRGRPVIVLTSTEAIIRCPSGAALKFYRRTETAPIATYEARWPSGTRQRVWLDVLVYTGLRRGDAVRFGRQHIRNGIGTIKTEKTDTVVTLPILPVLMKTLDAGPCGDLTFIAGENGRPLTKESFGNLFRKACREAGLRNRSAHGLRKAAATRAAENGATVAQLNAIFGWKGAKMATYYTEAADRRRLSLDAMHLLANDK